MTQVRGHSVVTRLDPFFPEISASIRHCRRHEVPLLPGAGGLAALAALALAGPGVASLDTPPAVVELFTSQGCSSCPPADALLGQLTEKPGVVALSYSVDYWDYLGWRDTLGSPANSERQRAYARSRGDGKVYTPQAVVDGITHVNGASEAAIEMAMRNAAKRLQDVRVPVSMRADGDTLIVDVGAAPEKSDRRAATVWLAIAKEVETVKVARGENRGVTSATITRCASCRRSACGTAIRSRCACRSRT